jgi:hypothetical protein
MPTLINSIPNILFKKYSGTVDTSVNNTVNQEPPILASPKIIPSLQIYNQEIPKEAPTNLVLDLTPPPTAAPYIVGLDTDNKLSLLCEKREYSSTHPWIVKYTNVKLSDFALVNGYSYKFAGTNPQVPYLGITNLLSQIIPFNYDPALSYQYYVNIWNGNDFISTKCDNIVNPWILDIDAGYLTFFSDQPQLASPKITFWRYEGTMGLPSSGGTVVEKETLTYYIKYRPLTVPRTQTLNENININSNYISNATHIDINIIDRTGFSKNNILSLLNPDDFIYITTGSSVFIHIFKIQFITNNQKNGQNDWSFIVEPLNPQDGSNETPFPSQVYSIYFDMNSNRIPIAKFKF